MYLASSRHIRSCPAVALLLLGLFVVCNLFNDRMFSLLTLQETHNIDTFAELADNVDVIPNKLQFSIYYRDSQRPDPKQNRSKSPFFEIPQGRHTN